MLHKSKASGRLVKWAIEISEFDINYRPRAEIKAQAFADFLAEFTEPHVDTNHEHIDVEDK